MAGGRQAGRSRGQAGERPPVTPAEIETLAEQLCPHKTEGEVQGELVPRARKPLTADEARAHAIEPVAAAVARTCAWGKPVEDWDVGDYRFLVLDFGPKKDVSLYIQIWSEPGEPVLIEACSGAWNTTAKPYVQAPQRAALRQLGYSVGGRARNYQKYWTLSPLADARALAEELVSIQVDVFGYRCQRPLDTVFCSESRTEAGRIFPGLTTDDVEQMLKIAGCDVVEAEPVEPVSPSVRRRLIHVAQPFPFVVEMRCQVKRCPATFETMRLITHLPAGRGLPAEVLEPLVSECPFGRTFRDDEGDLLFIQDLVVTGTTVRWFLTTLQVWIGMRNRALDLLRLVLAPPMPRASRGSGGEAGDTDRGDDGDEDDLDGEGSGADGNEGAGGGSRQARPARVTIH